MSASPLGAVVGPWMFDAHVTGRLQRLADAGCREVEAHLELLVANRIALGDAGLAATGGFIRTPVVTGTWDVWRHSTTALQHPRFIPPPGIVTLDEILDEAHVLPDLRTLTIALLLPEERTCLDDYRRLADAMNRGGERCRSAGLTLAYHAHSFEFAQLEESSGFATLMQRLDPDAVRIEVDVFWFAAGGCDPVAFVRQNGSRICALHLKDMSPGMPTPFHGSPWEAGTGWRVPVGQGCLDFASVLTAADAVGVRQRYVEDESEGSRFENLVDGLRYLNALQRSVGSGL